MMNDTLNGPDIRFTLPSRHDHVDLVGYSVQTHLLVWLLKSFDQPATAYLWFATELAPDSVDRSSSPLHIYEELLVAVQQVSPNAAKVRDLRAKYQLAIDSRVSDPLTRATLKLFVQRADVRWFRPVLMKLKLEAARLSGYRRGALDSGASVGERDEYLARSFPLRDSAIIVE